MYHAIVRRMARRIFERLSEGDYQSLLRGVADDVHHTFAGDHPLGGERHDRAAMERWFERLFRLFPTFKFEVKDVIADGWPWNTRVAVEWIARVTPQAGEPYMNEGAHIVQLRWGRITQVHAYENSQKVDWACKQMAGLGIDEAAARPITT